MPPVLFCVAPDVRGALEVLCICVVYIAPTLGVLLILLIVEIWLLSVILDLVVKLIRMLRHEKSTGRASTRPVYF